VTGEWRLSCGDALDFYDTWDTPTTIISDGAYGVGGFPGDPRTPADLPRWYEPHIAAWSAKATLATTLWLWNTEIGWANIHPLLTDHGWQYETLNIWNKGTGHIAGNVNSKTIRRFPVVTEVCAFYTRTPRLPRHPGSPQLIHMKEWLLSEWLRTGLPKADANKACGVKNAATRKYFDQGWLWYFPPVDVMMQLVAHAERIGLEVDDYAVAGKVVEDIFEELVGNKLWAPTFVYDFPEDTSPLTRYHRSKPGLTEKWDLYVRGFETATAYSELADPVVQRERFEAQALAAAKGDPEAMVLDEDFLVAMEQGFPPSGGMGMGIDRLLMVLTGQGIRETITFPLVKRG